MQIAVKPVIKFVRNHFKAEYFLNGNYLNIRNAVVILIRENVITNRVVKIGVKQICKQTVNIICNNDFEQNDFAKLDQIQVQQCDNLVQECENNNTRIEYPGTSGHFSQNTTEFLNGRQSEDIRCEITNVATN
ncbi:Hypothetical_protein [Hexamita inflata]|uniref:Hypothetical_protein n=1 Tax=Hexamita inflata TaxID=28002 RepID=A0AA86U3D8_9EUKA|nr:Hypothetical protein HINF_LOCUS24167 [Hexamita inflata]CAI9936525.1 Hypothetical protein HINF_LOCUS24170 [Hexamita inflata]CAI9936529.1 Hypothetical protein HINF_LOCUS24174 [Hexamita inflata]CAI9936532.1 Hypothetical protein HINF_LOCUS24177 [Hexamita inflata]CAI9967146.1 Hypothetical protein HINF_LOCUS54791 [Hexamita inflata]